MLVLSRKRDESIRIGDDVTVTIVDIRGDKVRLGVEAPQEIPVHRQEVYEAIQRENRRAGNELAQADDTNPTKSTNTPKPAEFASETRTTPDYKGMIEQIRRIIMSA